MAHLIAGNWKMNGSTESAQELTGALVEKLESSEKSSTDIVLCPPAPLIPTVLQTASDTAIMVGGQDCHWNRSGAHTGDVSADLLANLGCACVIVGHSERRADHSETDSQVKAKAEAAMTAGLIVIVCVGETETQRDAGDTNKVVGQQIEFSLPDGGTPETVAIAYEPVWAIGTGRTPSNREIEAVHAYVHSVANDKYGLGDGLRILYGGSVKPSNAAEILRIPGVDGALVGGASLSAGDFWAIIESCP